MSKEAEENYSIFLSQKLKKEVKYISGNFSMLLEIVKDFISIFLLKMCFKSIIVNAIT